MFIYFRSPKHSGFTPEAGGPETREPRSAKGRCLSISHQDAQTEPLETNSLKEFENIGEDETIYKLVGPVLLKQEKFEAESTVKGRLDFIGGEMLVTIHHMFTCI